MFFAFEFYFGPKVMRQVETAGVINYFDQLQAKDLTCVFAMYVPPPMRGGTEGNPARYLRLQM